MSYLMTFVSAFILAIFILPFVLRLSHKRGWYDTTGGRKIHKGNVPRLGGIGVTYAFFISFLIVFAIFNPPGRLPSPGYRFWLLLALGACCHALGLADDFRDLRGKFKFAIQFLIAALIVGLGYWFRVVELPCAPYELSLGWVGMPLTVLWIVGIFNAINLIDGMDGLAGGLVFIACATWAVIFYMRAEYLPAMVATAAGGAIFGFLFFNFPPASIFMGDSGSLFLGFVLAILPLIGSGRHEGDTGLIQSVTICLIPIGDTIAAILRRWRLGVSFFTADRYHVHHKLLNLGLNTRQSLAIIYTLAVISGAAALSPLYFGPAASFAMMLSAWVFIFVVFMVMHYFKVNEIVLVDRREPDEGPRG